MVAQRSPPHRKDGKEPKKSCFVQDDIQTVQTNQAKSPFQLGAVTCRCERKSQRRAKPSARSKDAPSGLHSRLHSREFLVLFVYMPSNLLDMLKEFLDSLRAHKYFNKLCVWIQALCTVFPGMLKLNSEKLWNFQGCLTHREFCAANCSVGSNMMRCKLTAFHGNCMVSTALQDIYASSQSRHTGHRNTVIKDLTLLGMEEILERFFMAHRFMIDTDTIVSHYLTLARLLLRRVIL